MVAALPAAIPCNGEEGVHLVPHTVKTQREDTPLILALRGNTGRKF